VQLCRAWVTLYGLSFLSACVPPARTAQLRTLDQRVQRLEDRLREETQRRVALNEQVLVLSGRQPQDDAASALPPEGISIAQGTQRPTAPQAPKVSPAASVAAPAVAKTRPAAVASNDGPVPPALRRALAAFGRGHYRHAFAQLQRFVQQQPQHPAVDRARYWMGECKLENGEWMAAIGQFARLQREHPKSPKLPEAMYKMGRAFEQLADAAEAEGTYRRLIATFPRSASAELASARLAGSKTHATLRY
jgi:tol-pal system protein YbgF